MEGYLFKWTNFIKGWTIRYFVLSKHILYYYKQKDDTEKNAIHLKIAKVIPEKNKKSFVIETGTNKIYLKANSESERDIWISAISNEIHVLNQSQFTLKDEKIVLTEDVFDKLTKANEDDEKRKTDFGLKLENKISEEGSVLPVENKDNFGTDNSDELKETMINFEKANFEENNKMIINKIDDIAKLIQNFQNTYFALSMGLENVNLAFMKNKGKDDLKKLYLDLITVKQDFKVDYQTYLRDVLIRATRM
jgi:hypothetical protein